MSERVDKCIDIKDLPPEESLTPEEMEWFAGAGRQSLRPKLAALEAPAPPGDKRLDRLDTDWFKVLQAHKEPRGAGAPLLGQLLEYYRQPAHRYLLGAVHDETVADELLQEFSVRFLRGDFWRADPAQGRFRNFVKKALCNLVANHRKKQSVEGRRQVQGLPDDLHSNAGDPVLSAEAALDRELCEQTRAALLEKVTNQLREFEIENQVPYCSLLFLRCSHPEMSSSELAVELTRLMKPPEPYNDDGVRKLLERARRKFADFLLKEIAESLPKLSAQDIEDEVNQLGLLPYCKLHLRNWLSERLLL